MSTQSSVSRDGVEHLAAKTAAAALGVSVWTVYRQIASGQLGAFRIGRQWRVYATAVTALTSPTP